MYVSLKYPCTGALYGYIIHVYIPVHGAVLHVFPTAQITNGGAAHATGKLRLGDHIIEVSVNMVTIQLGYTACISLSPL